MEVNLCARFLQEEGMLPFRCPKRELRHLVTTENLWNEHKNVILIITLLEENVEELRCDWCNMSKNKFLRLENKVECRR